MFSIYEIYIKIKNSTVGSLIQNIEKAGFTMTKTRLGALIFLIVIFGTGCSTSTMPQPQLFGGFSVAGTNAQRHSFMAVVHAISKQRGWTVLDVAVGCDQVKARAKSSGNEFSVDFVFTITEAGRVEIDVLKPKQTSNNGRKVVIRWIRALENTYNKYRRSSYDKLDRYVGDFCKEK